MTIPGHKSAPLSRIAIAAVMTVVVAWTCLKPQPWRHTISWDAFGYYLYLPAELLHGDIALKDMSWFNEVFQKYEPSATVYQINEAGNGGHAIKYSMGLAVLWAPFFGLGHLMARLSDQPLDGFSMPYQAAMVFASWSWLLLGLHWSRRALLRFFGDRAVALTIGLLVIGTNVFDQSVFHMMMPHVFLFTLFSGILHHTMEWERTKRAGHMAVVALLIGLSILVRPTAALVVLIPLLWGWGAGKAPLAVELVRSHRCQILLGGVVVAMVCLPQLLYWKEVTGEYFYVGYTNPGEGFEFGHPWIKEVLFSFRKGWLLYTPVMICAILGLVLLKRYAAGALLAVLVFFIADLYVVSSWSCWWYADSFGHRALMESYAFLALPLCAFVSRSISGHRKLRWAALAGYAALVALNVFQTWQCSEGILHSSRMTRKAYTMVFGRWEMPEGLEEALLVQRAYDGSMHPPDLARYTLVAALTRSYDLPEEKTSLDLLTDTVRYSGARSLYVDPHIGWSPDIGKVYADLTKRDHLWARFTMQVYVPPGSPHVDCAIVLCMQHEERKYGDHVREIPPEELLPGRWNEVTTWFLTPPIRDPQDRLYGFLWLRDTLPVWIDDARLELYEPRE